jgi:predicted nucleic acid-binding protein
MVYLALAFALKASLWSNDKKLKKDQKEISVFSTEELIEKTNFLKI